MPEPGGMTLRLGANTPYTDRPLPAETWDLLARLQPEEVRVTSFMDGDDLDRLLSRYPGALVHVRPRTGPSHQGAWPRGLLDYRSWPTERSLRDCLDTIISHNATAWLEGGNEPDIEMAREPVDTWEHIRDATAAYADWFHRLADDIAAAYGDRVRIAVAPLSQGAPDRFALWKARLNEAGCYARAHFISEHLYTDGRPSDDPDWGGRWQAWADLALPLDVTETNDNGRFFEAGADARAADIAGLLTTLRDSGLVRSASLFTLPGAPDDGSKPAWWWIGDEIVDEAVKVRPPAPVEPPTPAPPEPAPMPPPSALPTGIDVSNWQGTIDWDAVAASGIAFAFAKCSEGVAFRDPFFARNWLEMQRVGIVPGAYHFARLENDPTDEADYFVAAVQTQGIPEGGLLALDFEPDGSGDASGWVLTWLQRVEALVGYKPLCYTARGYIDAWDLANEPALGAYPLWLASWGAQFPDTPAPWDTVSMWQWTDNVTVPGIAGPVDGDRFNGPIERIRLYGKPASMPEPEPEPPPAPDEVTALREQVGGLVVALADMNDREGDKIRALVGELDGKRLTAERRHALMAQVRAALDEMDATRVEFVGSRS